MFLDVVILAGGYGTRLHGLWDHAKCLVPVDEDQTVLDVLLEQCKPLPGLRSVTLALGHKGNEVVQHIGNKASLESMAKMGCRLAYVVSDPLGTVAAMRAAMKVQRFTQLTLILNGDTIPQYPLSYLHEFYWANPGRPVAGWYDNKFSGQAIVNHSFIPSLVHTEHTDIWNLLRDLAPRLYHAANFTDIGTPETFPAHQT